MFPFFSRADLQTNLEYLDARLKQKQKDSLEQETKQLDILAKAQELMQTQAKQLDLFYEENQQLQKEVNQLKQQLEKMPKPCPRCGAGVAPTCGMSCASGGYYSD